MESSKEWLKRIEAMNGGSLRESPTESDEKEALRKKLRPKSKPESRVDGSADKKPDAVSPSLDPIRYRRDLPAVSSKPAYRAPDSSTFVSLEDAVPGEEILKESFGKAFLSEYRADRAGKDSEALNRSYRVAFETADSHVLERLTRLYDADAISASDLLFLDLETTGLGNSPVFLGGIMVWEAGTLVVRQYLARDYSEETALAALMADAFAGKKLLVTFNGKSFDMPYLRARAAVNGVPFLADPAHLDLLHESRRAWGRHLPDCKLQTLERSICLRTRHDDIPGSEVPEAYHAFVRTGNAVQLAQILKHNRLDLLTLAELLVKLPPLEPRRSG